MRHLFVDANSIFEIDYFTQVQHMLIALNERLVSVESCVVEQPESGHSNGGHDEEESSKRQKI